MKKYYEEESQKKVQKEKQTYDMKTEKDTFDKKKEENVDESDHKLRAPNVSDEKQPTYDEERLIQMENMMMWLKK